MGYEGGVGGDPVWATSEERGPKTTTRSRVGGCPQGKSSLGSGKALVKISQSCQKTQTWKVSKQREPRW